MWFTYKTGLPIKNGVYIVDTGGAEFELVDVSDNSYADHPNASVTQHIHGLDGMKMMFIPDPDADQ